MNKQAIFLTEKFHFFESGRKGRQKRAEGSTWGMKEIIALIMILLVVGGVFYFFYQNDINSYLRNLLPVSSVANFSQDEIVVGADELIANACPVKVAETYKKDGANAFISINGKETKLYSKFSGEKGSISVDVPSWFDKTIGVINVDKIVIIESAYLTLGTPEQTTLFNDLPIGADISDLQSFNGSISKGGIFCKEDPCVVEQRNYDSTIKFVLSAHCVSGGDRRLIINGKLSSYTVSSSTGNLFNSNLALIAEPSGSAGFYSFLDRNSPTELSGFDGCFYLNSNFGCTIKK
jgi:hypothetical protein